MLRVSRTASDSAARVRSGAGGAARQFAIALACLALGASRTEAEVFSPSPPPGMLVERGDIALVQALRDAGTDLVLMSLAAHPDDEDGATLAYYRKKYGLRTTLVHVTQGEGGQNEIGPELYRDLGVIRAFESRAAAAILGAGLINLNLVDFGYSKSAEEAFEFWGHERALGRMVEAFRRYRPDIIITNHDKVSGHGHHRAVGIMAEEAFDLAASPGAYPEQIARNLEPWQPSKLYVRTSDPTRATVTINVGEYDSHRGESYAQLSHRSLREHRSQGMGLYNVPPGPRLRHFILVKSMIEAATPENELFDGLPALGERVKALGRTLSNAILPQAQDGVLGTPVSLEREAVARKLRGALVEGRALREALRIDGATEADDGRDLAMRLERRLAATERALGLALSLDLRLAVDDDILAPGETFGGTVSLTNSGPAPIEEIILGLTTTAGWTVTPRNEGAPPRTLAPDSTAKAVFEVEVPADAPLTLPHRDHLYDRAFLAANLLAHAGYESEGMAAGLECKARVEVAPALEVELLPDGLLVPSETARTARRLTVRLTNRTKDAQRGVVRLAASRVWSVTPVERPFAFEREDEETLESFEARLSGKVTPGSHRLLAEARVGEAIYTDAVAVELADVAVAGGLRIGVVESYDTTIQKALQQLGIAHDVLDPVALKTEGLGQYDTIVIDLRAYLMRKDLRRNNGRLLDYVHEGGNLVVMYHKVWEWNPEHGNPQYAPYPLRLSRDRITDERAPITPLVPDHPLLSWPNRLGEADWEGWVQERGLYFPGEWDDAYQELLSAHDPGEEPLVGGYLVSRYGKGTYVYTSYVWYRQLRALHPGGFRAFANMLSLPRYEGQWPESDGR